MGLCHFGDRCWNTHELTDEQVERAIEAGKARRERDESERRRDTSSNRRRKRDEDEESKRDEHRDEKMEDEICAKYLMGTCYFGNRCWHTHELSKEQVERAIKAGKGRRVRYESGRRDTSQNRGRKRNEDEESPRDHSRNRKMEDEKKKEFLEVYKLWEEAQEKRQKTKR